MIIHKCLISLFGKTATFFLLSNLSTFDGNVGLDLLTQAGVSLCLSSETEQIEFHRHADAYFTNVDCADAPDAVKDAFLKMLKSKNKAIADPEEALPYNTSVVATIRTTDEQPVYVRLYAYPMGAAEFVNKEVQRLLKNGIIKKSLSPYNNPIWVVDDKGTDEFGNKNMRLVMDFRKLNEKTIADRYTMPNIPMILGNLGKAKYFSTLDLKSGYHQITLEERDREKTAFAVNGGKYEFCQLPFGLKNAASIFQRTVDDVLREQIGIIFSKDENSYVQHVE